MPVRRRTDKRSAAADAWNEIFTFGFDILNRAHMAGVKLDARLRPDMAEARAAWRRYGAQFLSEYGDDGEPWALTEFGKPGGRHAS